MLKLFSISLYISSFFPLWISVIFIDILSIIENKENTWTEYLSICCILIAVFTSSIIIHRELHKRGKEGSKVYTIKSIKEEKAITSEFMLSYILPLFAFDFTMWNQVVLFLVFFVTIGFLCVRHNYYSVNIILEIAGYRFYRCSMFNSDKVMTEHLVMSKQRLNEMTGMEIYVSALNNEYVLDVS